jgi:predicted acyltransferase
MFLVPIPPDGIAPNLEPSTNLGAWVDRMVFGTNHLWGQSKTWDPEGLLSTIPAIVNGIIGMSCGLWLQRSDKDIYQKISGLMVAGTLLLILAFIWDLQFPFNKKLWSSSFVLFTCGVALLLLGTVYWLVDAQKHTRWIKPFQVFGMNALFAYLLSGVFATLLYTISWTSAAGNSTSLKGWLYQSFFTSWLSPKNASLGFALFNVLVVLAFSWILYRKNIYIKV